MQAFWVFVFGSNLAGKHGKGAAFDAMKRWGAKWGVGEGPMGSSYAIPTKGHNLEKLPLTEIEVHVKTFIRYAEANPKVTFIVTRVGCGLAGKKNSEMAPLFKDAPKNCIFDVAWRPWMKGHQFFGDRL